MSEFTERLAESLKAQDLNALMTELGSAYVVKSATSSTSQAGRRARVEIELIRKEITRRATLVETNGPAVGAKYFARTTKRGFTVLITLSESTTARGARVASSAVVTLPGGGESRAEAVDLAQDALDEVAALGEIVLPFERYDLLETVDGATSVHYF